MPKFGSTYSAPVGRQRQIFTSISQNVSSYLSVHLMKSIFNGPLHILLPIGKCEWDTISTRDNGNHFAISTLTNERIKRNHLRIEEKETFNYTVEMTTKSMLLK